MICKNNLDLQDLFQYELSRVGFEFNSSSALHLYVELVRDCCVVQSEQCLAISWREQIIYIYFPEMIILPSITPTRLVEFL